MAPRMYFIFGPLKLNFFHQYFYWSRIVLGIYLGKVKKYLRSILTLKGPKIELHFITRLPGSTKIVEIVNSCISSSRAIMRLQNEYQLLR